MREVNGTDAGLNSKTKPNLRTQVYDARGTYAASLTVTDKDGASRPVAVETRTVDRRAQKLCHSGRFASGRECVFVDESAEDVAAMDCGVGSGSRLRDRSSVVRRA
jgi:hypothetical protein